MKNDSLTARHAFFYNKIGHEQIDDLNEKTVHKYMGEGSAVWRKVNGVWEKQTPYFESIKKVGNIYVCKQSFSETKVWKRDSNLPGLDKWELASIEKKPAQYVVLNSDLKPVEVNEESRFDVVEILNEELKIESNGQAFTLDSNGRVTNK